MLTYILGAGASFQSIPLVNTFPKRFKEFVSHLGGYMNDISFEAKSENIFKEAIELATALGSAFEDHQSFDTYFKKLFHTNEIKLIKKYKKVPNLYFIWEHVQNIGSQMDEYGNLIEGIDSFQKKSKVDKRYDALIAGLLEPIEGKTKMFCVTNFITWNYDLNLISSIKNYFFPNLTFIKFLEEIEYEKPVWNIKNQIFIVNMNGFFYSELFNDYKNIYDLNPSHLIRTRLSTNYFDDDYFVKDAEFIKFAWEQDNVETKISHAKKMIDESKNLIIIGYTFPLYNRIVDSLFLADELTRRKNIIIQDPNAEDLSIDFVTTFEDLNPQASVRIKIKKNCNQFFVPSDIANLKVLRRMPNPFT
jgi:hypothetical protein